MSNINPVERPETVYEPRQDSYLLRDAVLEEALDGRTVLDMGTGSGIIAVAAAREGAEVTAVDIQEEAVNHVRRRARESGLDIDVFRSDLFTDVSGTFDLVAFNPPYVPGREEEIDGDEVWDGGKHGRELVDRFISAVGDHLSSGGACLLLQSTRNGLAETRTQFSRHGMASETVGRENLPWEELVVFRAARSE